MFVTPYYYCCCCTINSTHSHGKGINHTHTAGSAAVSRVALLSLPFELKSFVVLEHGALSIYTMHLQVACTLFFILFVVNDCCCCRVVGALPHATYQYSCPAVRYTVVRTYSSTYFAALHHESLGIFKSRPCTTSWTSSAPFLARA